jgi:hypothetical protein
MNLMRVPLAIAAAEKDYRGFDSDRNAVIEEVHRLTRAGVSAKAIATLVGMSDRQVQRIRGVEEPAKTWYRFDQSEIRSERLERTAAAALDLACRIRDEDPQLVFRSLDLMERQTLMELTMILLAAFPIDLTVDEIFEWVLP